MKKQFSLLYLVAFSFLFFATSCSKERNSSSDDDVDNFRALVLSGQSIDPNQTWTSATKTPIKVTVNLQSNQAYKVYIFLTNPSIDSESRFLGRATMASGETKTIYIAKPNYATKLYAACLNSDGQGFYKEIIDSEVIFDNSNINIGRSQVYYNSIYYAFDFPDTTSDRDFDFNDLVLQVSALHDNEDGTYTSYLSVAALGTDMDTYLYYNDEQIGAKEIHELLDTDHGVTINTTKITMQPRYIGELTFNTPDVDLTKLSFSVRIAKSEHTSKQTYTQDTYSPSPLYVVVCGDTNGKWRWPKEGANIAYPFPGFVSWAINQQTATDWYLTTNANSYYLAPAW